MLVFPLREAACFLTDSFCRCLRRGADLLDEKPFDTGAGNNVRHELTQEALSPDFIEVDGLSEMNVPVPCWVVTTLRISSSV